MTAKRFYLFVAMNRNARTVSVHQLRVNYTCVRVTEKRM